tara:strand:+ start:1643 stop:1987 length:345 start_codon:yes stop_codon:yes gene_type:complete
MEDELKVNVFEFVKDPLPEGRTSDDGKGADDLRAYLLDNWEKYQKIVVSFDGIVKMSRVFIDEAFAKILDEYTVEEFNRRMYFPDAKEGTLKAMNAAFKLRMKITKAAREREEI